MPIGEPRVENKIFVGMWSNMDPHDLQEGQSQLQVNVWSPRAGELAVRRGLRKLEYDSE